MQKKLAFSTLGCPAWNFEKVISNAVSMGFSGVEIRGIGDELQTDQLPCFLPENQTQTKRILEEAGILICGIGTSVLFHDPDKYEQCITEGFHALDICMAMNIPSIRVFGDAFPEDQSRSETINRVASGIDELCTYAEKNGQAKVLLEIHGEFNTTQSLIPLFAQLNHHPSFGVIWDIEHSFRAYNNNITDFYQTIKPFIRHVHVKDCRIVGTDVIVCLPGEGDIDISACLGLLEQDGYDGYYSFEWEKRWIKDIPEPEKAFPCYIDFMKKCK